MAKQNLKIKGLFIKCVYCQNDLIADRVSNYCKNCSSELIHIRYFDGLNVIQFIFNMYGLEIDYDRNVLSLVAAIKTENENYLTPDNIISINNIPKNINPSNAKEWIKKLLNLKAFL